MQINVSGNSFAKGGSVIGRMTKNGVEIKPTYCTHCGGKTFPALGPACPYCGAPVKFN